MNLIQEKFLSQGHGDKINIIKYNPWLGNNDETLLREFFMLIACKQDDETKRVFQKCGSMAILASNTVVNAFLPGLGAAFAEGIALAKNAFDDCKDTIFEMKKNVSEAVIRSKKHLVVMIDDVDRLDKDELNSVLRLPFL